VAVGRPDAAVAPIEFMMDPQLAAHPFPQEEDGAAQADEAGGDPEDGTRKQLIAMGNGYRRARIMSRAGKFYEASKQGDADPGRSQKEQ